MSFKEGSGLGSMFYFFVTLLIGIVLIQALADPLWENQNNWSTTNDTIDVQHDLATDASGEFLGTTTFQLNATYINEVTSVTIGNGTSANWTTLSEGTGYTIDEEKGTFQMVNSSLTKRLQGNHTIWQYTSGELYVEGDSAPRTILGLVLILFVIGMVGWAALFVVRKWIMGTF